MVSENREAAAGSRNSRADHHAKRNRAPRIGQKRHQFLARTAISPGTAREQHDFPQHVAPAVALPGGIQQSHQAEPGDDALAAGGLRRSRFAQRNAQQCAGQIDAAEPGVHRLDQARVGVDETGRTGCFLADVVERQCAVPIKRVPDPLDDLAHLRIDKADLEHVAAARSLHDLPVDVTGDQSSTIEHGLRALERSGHRGLHQNSVGESALLQKLRQHRVALLPVAHPPDPGARGAERGLDEERIGPRRDEFIGRTNEFGRRLRHVESRQQFGEASLALHLLEGLEIGQRQTKVGREAFGARRRTDRPVPAPAAARRSCRLRRFRSRPSDSRPDRRLTPAPDARGRQSAKSVQRTRDRWKAVRHGGRRGRAP